MCNLAVVSRKQILPTLAFIILPTPMPRGPLRKRGCYTTVPCGAETRPPPPSFSGQDNLELMSFGCLTSFIFCLFLKKTQSEVGKAVGI